MRFKLLAARPLADEWVRFLASGGVSVVQGDAEGDPRGFRSALGSCDGLLCFLTHRVDPALIAIAPRLRLIANVAVGFDNIDVAAAARRGIGVTNTPGCLTDAVADLTMGLILAAARRLAEADRFVRAGRFRGWTWDLLQGMELAGRTLGIVGFGRTGQAVARRARGFGMRVTTVARRSFDRRAWPDVCALPWRRFLTVSDVVSLHVPLTRQTRHLIGPRELRTMKRTAILVNVSRGPVVDERALVAALRKRVIAGAALDVYEKEPALAPGLATLANVVLTPHIGSATVAARQRMLRMACENVLAVARGKTPPNLVTGPRRIRRGASTRRPMPAGPC